MNTETDRSRTDLVQWINELLKTNLSKIEQLGTGAVYCQLFDILYPGKITLNRVNWKAKNDYEYVQNFKILQLAFTKLNIPKPIEIERLIKCRYSDNLEFLQWFKKFFDSHNNIQRDYDPIQKRNGQDLENNNNNENGRGVSRNKFSCQPKAIQGGISNYLSKNSSTSNLSGNKENDHQHVAEIKNHTNLPPKQGHTQDLHGQIEAMKQERDYYFNKLKEIDQLIQNCSQDEFQQTFHNIRQLLYQTNDQKVTLKQDGSLNVLIE